MDETHWFAAAQKTSALIGLVLSPPAAAKKRQIEYSNWIEERLAAPVRTSQPTLFEGAIKTLSEFFEEMVEGNSDIPIDLRKRVVADLAMNLHPNVERQLVNASEVATALGIKTTPVVTFNGTHTVIVESFVGALRSAVGGKKSATITRGDGSKSKVSLQYAAPGTVTITFDGARFTFTEADLLANTKAGRKRALKRLFSQRPLSADEDKVWFKRAEKGALSATEYSKLLEQLRSTPENVVSTLSAPQSLNAESLVPKDLSYYVRLVGPIPQLSFADYIARERKEHLSLLLRRELVGLRRLAYSAISRPLIPFDDLDSLALTEIEKLLTAEDPFSLIFGFEICQHRLGQGRKAAGALGTKFLKRLLGDEKWLQSRLELFSACAVIGMVALRPAANDPEPALSWFRLAVLTHAGVLTTALRGLQKTADFLKWSIRDFGSTYLWRTVVDARDEPRWEAEWISPEALKAELVGRCFNALMQLPPAKQPKAWKDLINSELNKLRTKLLAFFPGPLDGFLPFVSAIQAKGAIDEVRSLLKGQSSFKRAPGIITLAYGGAIDTRLKDEIFRLLESSNEQLAKLKTADQILRCCAYIAAINRDGELGRAVVARCLRLISPTMKPDAVLQLLLFSMHACAANGEPAAYYREAATIATRFAFAVPLGTALEMRKVLEIMKCRDPRLAASFGRAEAILDAALLAAA
jgi:hypothetical protein